MGKKRKRKKKKKVRAKKRRRTKKKSIAKKKSASKTSSKYTTDSEGSLVFKVSDNWSKQAYVNKNQYEKKYKVSIKDNVDIIQSKISSQNQEVLEVQYAHHNIFDTNKDTPIINEKIINFIQTYKWAYIMKRLYRNKKESKIISLKEPMESPEIRKKD